MKIKRKYQIDKNGIYVILMPDSDHEFNEYALRHIDDFLNYRKGISVLIYTTDEWTKENAKQLSKRITAVELITRKVYRYFYYYYYYYGFTERFIMMSLQGVYGERLALIENVNGITKEDMSCLGIYIIRNWVGMESGEWITTKKQECESKSLGS